MEIVEGVTPLATLGKSNTIRAGDCIAKPVGSVLIACENPIFMTSTPDCVDPVTDSIAFCAFACIVEHIMNPSINAE
jgi:hypothetical protein